jgi:hypothetical protein
MPTIVLAQLVRPEAEQNAVGNKALDEPLPELSPAQCKRNYDVMMIARGRDDSKAYCWPCRTNVHSKVVPNKLGGFHDHTKSHHDEPLLKAGQFAVCNQPYAALKDGEIVYEGKCQTVITGANFMDHQRMHALKSVFCRVCGECFTRRSNFKTRHATESSCLRCTCGIDTQDAQEFLNHAVDGCVTLGRPPSNVVGNSVEGSSVKVRLVCRMPKGTHVEGTVFVPSGEWLKTLLKTQT